MANPDQVAHGGMFGKLFKLKEDVMGSEYSWNGGDYDVIAHPLPEGTVVKVTMVSRFGDCGITDDLTREIGFYLARVPPDMLEPVMGDG